MHPIKSVFLSALLIAGVSLSATVSAQAPAAGAKVLKVATLAPEGSTLAKGLLSMKKEVVAKTGGKVDFQIYFGGTAGDEKDVVRKMRIGQLHGAALTGVGLGMIEPEIRVLELPFLFKNYNQADAVYNQLHTYFEQKFEQKGFMLLGWAEVGFVKIFSNKAISKKADLTGMKMWMWEGDPLAQAMYEAFGIVPVPLAITDVTTSLQTKLIDGCYAPELAAIAFQWHTKVKYMTDVNLVDGTGGVLIAKSEWAKLSPAEQGAVKEVIGAEGKKLIAQTRSDNLQSQAALTAAGVQVVKPAPEAVAELEAISKTVHTKLVGKLYPQSLLDKVNQIIAANP